MHGRDGRTTGSWRSRQSQRLKERGDSGGLWLSAGAEGFPGRKYLDAQEGAKKARWREGGRFTRLTIAGRPIVMARSWWHGVALLPPIVYTSGDGSSAIDSDHTRHGRTPVPRRGRCAAASRGAGIRRHTVAGGSALPSYHAESDTVDRVNARELRANTALASSLVWWLAENPERFGRRLTREEVGRLLSNTKLDAQMKAFAQWEDYQSGKRGVNK